MVHPYVRTAAAGLLLLAGCASPNALSGLLGKSSPKPEGSIASNGARKGSSLIAGQPPRDAGLPPDGMRAPAPRAEENVQRLLAEGARNERAGNLSAAKAAYERVLNVDRDHPVAHYQLAVIADNERRFPEAEAHYMALLRQTPRDPDLLASLGWSYQLQGRYDESERALRDALRYDGTHRTALYNLGWLYGRQGNYDQAMAVFRSAGSENEAQSAIAELFPNGRPPAEAIAAVPQNSLTQTEHQIADARGNAKGAGAGAGSEKQYPNEATRKLAEEVRKQRELMEKQMGGRPSGKSRNNVSAPSPGGANDRRPPAYGQQPGGWNQLSQNPREGNDFNRMFSEIDAASGHSQSQANHPRSIDEGPHPGFSGIRQSSAADSKPPVRWIPDGGVGVGVEQAAVPSASGAYPVITPGNSNSSGGVRTADGQSPSRPPVIQPSISERNFDDPATWNRLPEGPSRNAPMSDLPQWQGNSQSSPPPGNWPQTSGRSNDGMNSGAYAPAQNGVVHAGGTQPQSPRNYQGQAPAGNNGMPPVMSPWQQAQMTAAQLGLNAGPGGSMFPMQELNGQGTPNGGGQPARNGYGPANDYGPGNNQGRPAYDGGNDRNWQQNGAGNGAPPTNDGAGQTSPGFSMRGATGGAVVPSAQAQIYGAGSQPGYSTGFGGNFPTGRYPNP